MEDRARVAMTLEQCWHRVPGGTAVAAIGMARALAGRGEVELVGVSARHRAPPAPGWEPPIEVRPLALPRVALYESWHRLRRPAIEGATGPIDVIHATTIAIPPRSAPLVVTIHDLAFLHDSSHFTRRGMSFFHRGLELTRKDADLVLCPSEATARDCLSAGISSQRVRVIPLGIEPRPATEELVANVRDKYSLSARYLLWSGTIEPRKNLGALLAAWRQLDDPPELVLVGPEGWNEDLDALVAGAAEKPKVLGFVPRSDLDALYAGATAFVWPSLREGFGFPVLEAMSQGTPVVTSLGTSTEEIAGDAAILVDPENPGAIAEGIARLLGDPALALRLSTAGRRRAAGFTWDRTAIALGHAYAELAGVAA